MLALIDYPNIDPVLIHLGPLAIRWYGIAYVLGLLLGILLLRHIARTPRFGFSPDDASDFMIWAVVGVFAGGRLGSVFFYDFPKYLDHPLQVFAVWEGGMSFHGGVIGVVLALILYCRRKRIRLLAFGDATVCCVPIGLFFGRLANFINGELFGRPSDVPWAMIFPRAPDQIPTPRHPSQLYEAFLEGVVLFTALWILRVTAARRLGHGFLSGCFLLGYALARTLVEQFREPDLNIGFLFWGLTMGQLLSFPMILVGAALIWHAWRFRETSTPQAEQASR